MKACVPSNSQKDKGQEKDKTEVFDVNVELLNKVVEKANNVIEDKNKEKKDKVVSILPSEKNDG